MTGRSCGSCTLCCKVMGVAALNKPQGAWCSHCLPGRGCGIYEERPAECRTFLCDWLTDMRLGPEWKPEKSKIVLVPDRQNNRLVAHVDPATPSAWKRQPYLDYLNAQMRAGLPQGRLVFISLAGRLILLLPDRHEELGLVSPRDEVALEMIRRPSGMEYRVQVIRP